MEMPLSKQQLEKLFKERLKTVHQTQPLLKVEMDMGPATDFPAKRDYGYCLSDGKNALIVFAPKVLKAPKAQVDALMRHELAHAYLIAAKLSHSERECDAVAQHLFGDPIYYDAKDVQTLDRSKAKSFLRPTYLPNPAQPEPLFRINDRKFNSKVRSAFRMLSPKDKAYVSKYVDAIEFAYKSAGAESGYHADYPYRSNQKILLARPTLNASKEWLASVLVHESVHGEQGMSYYKDQTKGEQEANKRQLKTLIEVRGKDWEIEHLRRQVGDHWGDKRRWNPSRSCSLHNPPVQNPPSLLNEKYAEGMRDYLTRFSGADAFARSVSRPPLAQSVSNVAGIMDAASYTRLDMDHIRDVLESYADWYFLYEIPVDEADWQALHTSTSPVHVVEPSGKEDLTKPIIVGSDGEVIDGRHRVLLARKRGIEVLPAYIPADRLYALLMGETQ